MEYDSTNLQPPGPSQNLELNPIKVDSQPPPVRNADKVNANGLTWARAAPSGLKTNQATVIDRGLPRTLENEGKEDITNSVTRAPPSRDKSPSLGGTLRKKIRFNSRESETIEVLSERENRNDTQKSEAQVNRLTRAQGHKNLPTPVNDLLEKIKKSDFQSLDKIQELVQEINQHRLSNNPKIIRAIADKINSQIALRKLANVFPNHLLESLNAYFDQANQLLEEINDAKNLPTTENIEKWIHKIKSSELNDREKEAAIKALADRLTPESLTDEVLNKLSEQKFLVTIAKVFIEKEVNEKSGKAGELFTATSTPLSKVLAYIYQKEYQANGLNEKLREFAQSKKLNRVNYLEKFGKDKNPSLKTQQEFLNLCLECLEGIVQTLQSQGVSSEFREINRYLYETVDKKFPDRGLGAQQLISNSLIRYISPTFSLTGGAQIDPNSLSQTQKDNLKLIAKILRSFASGRPQKEARYQFVNSNQKFSSATASLRSVISDTLQYSQEQLVKVEHVRDGIGEFQRKLSEKIHNKEVKQRLNKVNINAPQDALNVLEGITELHSTGGHASEILNDHPQLFDLLEAYAAKLFTEQDFEFWRELQAFQHSKKPLEDAKRIIDTFIGADKEKGINIDKTAEVLENLTAYLSNGNVLAIKKEFNRLFNITGGGGQSNWQSLVIQFLHDVDIEKIIA